MSEVERLSPFYPLLCTHGNRSSETVGTGLHGHTSLTRGWEQCPSLGPVDLGGISLCPLPIFQQPLGGSCHLSVCWPIQGNLHGYLRGVGHWDAKNQNFKGHGVSKGKEREQRASIRFKTTLMNTLMDVLRHRPGWVEVKDEGEWDFYWCDVSWLRENFDHTYMDEHVRISHFRNHYELTRKNYMVKNLKRFRKQLEREAGKPEAAKCDFFPKTFELPCEYHLFVEEFRKNPGITWIMKPGTVGKKLASLELQPARSTINLSSSHEPRTSEEQKDEIPVENYVAQRYIENPYLIGGRKFDLRVYVLVMSPSCIRAGTFRCAQLM